jgi:hypothetical protein
MGMPLVCQSTISVAVPTGMPLVIASTGQTRVKGM